MAIAFEDVHRPSHRKRSHRKRSSRRARRATQVIGWSVVGIVMATAFVAGAIYLLISSTGVLGTS